MTDSCLEAHFGRKQALKTVTTTIWEGTRRSALQMLADGWMDGWISGHLIPIWKLLWGQNCSVTMDQRSREAAERGSGERPRQVRRWPNYTRLTDED